MSPDDPVRTQDARIAATKDSKQRIAELESQLAELTTRLCETQETLQAIHRGDVDAIVVSGERGQQVFTLTNADRPYRILIEHMQEGAATLSPEGIVLFCNDSFAKLTGVPMAQIAGAAFSKFIRPVERPILDMVLGSSQGGSVELTLAAAEGAGIPIRLSFSRILDNLEGTILCVIVTDLREQHQIMALERGHTELARLVEERTASLLRLVEERRRDEEKLRQSEKLQLVGQLTGGIAHDFNNVLQVMSGGVALMKSPRLSAEQKTTVLDGMEHAAKNATEMVSRLLAFGRKQALRPRIFNLNEEVLGLTDIICRTLGSQVEVKTDLAPDLWAVSADPNQFEAALLNLIVNARDAMPSGGTLTLRTHNEFSSRAELVCLAVGDTGIGMAPAVRERIFEPFFSTKEAGKGTGLGLSQVHGFAKQSGGDVFVESAPGEGTTIILWLPRASGGAAAGDIAVLGAESSEMPGGGEAIVRAAGKVVLVVDDNREVAAFAASLLEGIGYAVRLAENAPEALAQLGAGERVDAVFSDVVMPGDISGVDFANVLIQRYPHVAVVLATGYTDKLTELSALPVEVLTKPYRLDQLTASLERAMNKISLGRD